MDILFTKRTLQNNKRKPNEDYSHHEIVGDAHLFVVADGNDLAPIYSGSTPDLNVSRFACERFIANYKELDAGSGITNIMNAAFDATLVQVCHKIREVEKHQYQSTTLTALAVCKNRYSCFHVGDGALYHFSKAAQTAARTTPMMAPDDITIFVEPGTLAYIKAHTHAGGIDPGDVLLLTTDGLLHLWGDGLAEKLKDLSIASNDPSDSVDCLFEKRRDVRKHDDLTCFVIKAL